MEAKLIGFVVVVPTGGCGNNDVPGLHIRKKVWATVLAIKLFETQLAGERSVWQLMVDKARAWMGGVVAAGVVGVEDITRLEKMAGEVLGVVVSS